MTTYAITVERGERYWVVTVPALERSTQARTRDEVEPMARDLIELTTGTNDFMIEQGAHA